MERGRTSRFISAATARSFAGFAKEKSSNNATASGLWLAIWSTNAESAARSGERSMEPSADVRSSTPKRSSGAASGGAFSKKKTYKPGLFLRPTSFEFFKPLVVHKNKHDAFHLCSRVGRPR